jgi:arsenate reductase-like glutaredoxin family protein
LLASKEEYQNVYFASICCDRCDGAREIIEEDDELRWKHIHHYYMDPTSKEEAKRLLEFHQVPFYVILNEQGEIVQKGSQKYFDFTNIPGAIEKKTSINIGRPAVANWEFTLDADF